MNINKIESGIEKVWKKLRKPHEYQILIPSIWVGAAIEYILNNHGINIRDIPPQFVSESVVYAGFLTTVLSLYKYSTGKTEDISSKARADNTILQLSQNGDILRWMCNIHYESGINNNIIKDVDRTQKEQRELKYTYLAMILLASYIIRGEKWPCYECYTQVCNNWEWESPYRTQDSEQNTYYKKVFREAIKHITEVEEFKDPVSHDSVSLIVEVINTLEDIYDRKMAKFAQKVWASLTTVEEWIALAQLTVRPEIETVNYLKEQARNRKAFYYLLISLSAASMGRTEWVEALEWINNYFIKDIIDFLASHANAIVGTTVTYISARAIGTMNFNNIITKYISKRLTPDTRRVILEEDENHN